MKALMAMVFTLTLSGFCCGGLISQVQELTGQGQQAAEMAEAAAAVASGAGESEEVAEAILSAAGVEAEIGNEIDYTKYLGMDLPLPPDVQPIFSAGTDEGVMARYQTGLSGDEVVAFFETQLTQLGFEQEGEMSFNSKQEGALDARVFRRDKVNVAITVFVTEDGAEFQIFANRENGGN